MATLREWLEEEDFDWATGKIIIQDPEKNSRGRVVCHLDPWLDTEFYTGYGVPEAPCFIAEDKEKLYFPEQYDGATNITVIYKNIMVYTQEIIKGQAGIATPYPGD